MADYKIKIKETTKHIRNMLSILEKRLENDYNKKVEKFKRIAENERVQKKS
jgi:hypothetical protein